MRTYLLNHLFEAPCEAFDNICFQLIHMYKEWTVDAADDANSLRSLITTFCSHSVHISLKVVWMCMADSVYILPYSPIKGGAVNDLAKQAEMALVNASIIIGGQKKRTHAKKSSVSTSRRTPALPPKIHRSTAGSAGPLLVTVILSVEPSGVVTARCNVALTTISSLTLELPHAATVSMAPAISPNAADLSLSVMSMDNEVTLGRMMMSKQTRSDYFDRMLLFMTTLQKISSQLTPLPQASTARRTQSPRSKTPHKMQNRSIFPFKRTCQRRSLRATSITKTETTRAPMSLSTPSPSPSNIIDPAPMQPTGDLDQYRSAFHPASSHHHVILALLPDECIALSSRDKAPFTVLAEIAYTGAVNSVYDNIYDLQAEDAIRNAAEQFVIDHTLHNATSIQLNDDEVFTPELSPTHSAQSRQMLLSHSTSHPAIATIDGRSNVHSGTNGLHLSITAAELPAPHPSAHSRRIGDGGVLVCSEHRN